MTDDERCCARVWRGRMGLGQCVNRAKYHEGGKPWCGKHAPSEERRRGEAQRKRHDREAEEARRRQEIARLKGDVLGVVLAMPFDELPERVKPLMAKIRNLEAKKP